MAVKREQVVQTAEKYVSRGKIEPAIREYRKLLEENPNDINTLNRVGDLYARIQRIDEAVDFFNQIAEQYAAEGFFVKAIAIYKKIIKLDPTRLDVYESLAELYHRQGLVTEARTQYQVLADYYQKHENATSAIAIYQKMAELEPANPTYHVKLAELYHQQKLSEKAIGEYRVIAELMLQHGHTQEAAQVYERALSIDSQNIAFITDAALKLKQAGSNAMASRFLAAAIDRNPLAERVVHLVGLTDESAHAALAAAFAAPDAMAPVEPVAPMVAMDPMGSMAHMVPPSAAEFAAAAAAAAAAPPAPVREPPRAPAVPPAAPPADEEDHVPFFNAPPLPEAEAESAGGLGAVLPPPAGGLLAGDDEIELDLEMDLDLVDPESAELLRARSLAVTGPPAAEEEQEAAFEVEDEATAAGGPGAAAPARGEDVFVLDIESDEEPSSLVKPPPDMLQGPQRPAWSQESRTGPGAAASVPSPAAPATPSGGAGPAASAAGAFPPPAGQETVDLGPIELVDPLAGFGEVDLAGPFGAASLAPDLDPAALGRLPPGLLAPPAAAPTGQPAPPAAAAPGLPPPAPPALPPEAPAPTLKIDPALLERTAAEIRPQASEREEDLVSEAEVLAKYGLQDKAVERLREALRIRPNHLGAYALLIQLQLEKGKHARVADLAQQMWRASMAGRDRDLWPKMRKRLLAAGYRLDDEHVLPPPDLAVGAVAAPASVAGLAPATTPPAAPGLAADLAARLARVTAAPAPLGGGPAAGASSGAAAEHADPDAARKRQTGRTRIDQILAGLRASAPVKVPAPAAASVEVAPPAAAPVEVPAASEPVEPLAAAAPVEPPPPLQFPIPAAPEEPAAGPPPPAVAATEAPLGAAAATAPPEVPPPLAFPVSPAAEPPAAPPPAAAHPGRKSGAIFNPLEIGAMVENESIDWDQAGASGAGGFVAASGDSAPSPFVAMPAAALASAAPPGAVGAGARARAGGGGPSPASLDDTGMSWLDEADTSKKKAAKGSSFFDDEDEFFDLAGELEQELSKEPEFQPGDLLVQPAEQSLEEIVEGFKRGVAEHLSPTDYDTHFNLGIAYREMGLLDEAIGEFQLAAKDSRYLVACCSMLGLCFLDKGLPELAIKWYRRGLEAPGLAEDDTLGLLYDMGCAYVHMGDVDSAYKIFVEVYGVNSNYRDIVARIEELGHPH
jgi:tetratricopeptide (TPR) repeat protein